MKKIFIGLISLFILTACSGSDYKASVLDAGNAKKPETIKLGIIAPLSGDGSAYGDDMRKIFDYEVGVINQKAEKQGKEFELVYEDGKCAGPESAAAIQKLTDVDGIKLIVGGVCSSETLAAAPVAQSKGVLLFSATSSAPDVEKEGDYIFSLSYRDDLVGQGLAKEFSQFKKIAIITEQNDYNVSLRKVVLDNLDKNVQVVADETFAKGGSDFRNILEKVAKAKPDAILLNPNIGATANNLIKQLSEIPALEGIQLISPYSYLADDSRSEALKAAEGMIIIDSPKLTDPVFLKKLYEVSAVKGGINTIGLYYSASSFDALDIVATLALEFGDNAEKIKDALRSRTFEGYLGEIYFGKDNFIQNVPVGRYVVTDGKAVYQN